MKKRAGLGWLVAGAFSTVAAVAGCGKGGGEDGAAAEGARGSIVRDVASALTSNLSIQDGTVELGPMPGATARDIMLADVSFDGALDPDGVVLLGFDVEAPGGELPEEVLMQFESAEDHIVAPVMASGAANHVEIQIDVGGGVCDDLCNVEHEIELTVAVRVESGDVSSHVTVEVTLDCRDAGSASACVTIDESGQPVEGSSGGGSGGAGGSSTGGSSTGTDVPSGVDVDAACDRAINDCPGVFDSGSEPAMMDPMDTNGPGTVEQCTQGIGCLFDNADSEACTDMLTEIATCLADAGSTCADCTTLVQELDSTTVCDQADLACFGSSGSGGTGGMTGGGSGGVPPDAPPDCAGLPLDQPVSSLTEMEAADVCRCAYEAAMPMDVARVECTSRAVFSPQTPAECTTSVEACLNSAPVICDGAEQLRYIQTCTGTLADLQSCFEAATRWEATLTCASAGLDPCSIAGYPQCLRDLCGGCTGDAIAN